MKKIVFTVLCTVLSIGTFAQKTTVRMQDTQARLLDVSSNAYVKPLTVELNVQKDRVRKTWNLTKDEAENQMNGDLANIRAWAVYKTSQLYDCDVIVAATFNFRTNDKADGYEIEVVGFPANFINWKTATQADYEWIKMEKVQTTSDRDKIQAVVKK